MKKILFVNFGKAADDRTAWSGIPFSIMKELSKYYNVTTVAINAKPSRLDRVVSAIERILKKRMISGEHLISTAKKASFQVENLIKENSYSCVFVIGGLNIAYVENNVPIIYFSDAVFSNMIDYYWYHASKKFIKEGNIVQQKSLSNATKVVLTSQWAGNEAINYYQTDASKIELIHFGANIEVEQVVHRKHDNINLLFVGVDWERKGGTIAVECVRHLNKIDKKNKYVLHLVGAKPPYKISEDYIKVYGFLNRNEKKQREQLDFLRETADIFILPTKAECAGIVFCEACAYGLPSITFATGGTPDYVEDGMTGYTLPLGATYKEFADKIYTLANDSDSLEKMKQNARQKYENDLNWKVFGKKLNKVIEQLI
jgi:hypothetical protein